MTEYRCSRRFVSQVFLIGESRFQFANIGATFAVSGNQKRASAPYERRLFSISTNEKHTIQVLHKILKRKRHQLTRIAPNYIVPVLAVSGNVPPQRPPREEVERCRRDMRRAPQSPSPVSMTAPARRETNAPGRCMNRISDIRPTQQSPQRKVAKTGPGTSPGRNPAPIPVHYQAIIV